MINLTIRCTSSENDVHIFSGDLAIKAFNVTNPDEIANEIASQCDPGLLVTESNQDLFLDVIGVKHIKEYLRDEEGP